MREKIIRTLQKELKEHPNVHAAWLEGSLATGNADEHSDIDIWFDIDDDSVSETFSAIERALESVGTIDGQFSMPDPNEHIRSRVYHLAGTPPTLQIDIDLQLHSRDMKFTHGVVDQDIKVLFDKDGTIKFEDLNILRLKKQHLVRLAELESRWIGMRPAVDRQVTRGKFLEVVVYYHRWVLDPLVEVLRMAYQPTKTEFGLKHIYRDIPEDTAIQLEDLFRLNTVKEMPEKLRQADQLFARAVQLIKKNSK